MLFLMMLCRDRVPVDASPGDIEGDVEEWVTEMDARGLRLAGDPLSPDADAVTVRVRKDEVQVERGAFLDSGGALFGFDLLDCKDLDEAITVAAAHPLAARHVMELRPVRAL